MSLFGNMLQKIFPKKKRDLKSKPYIDCSTVVALCELITEWK